jgi:hypothetical protein
MPTESPYFGQASAVCLIGHDKNYREERREAIVFTAATI